MCHSLHSPLFTFLHRHSPSVYEARVHGVSHLVCLSASKSSSLTPPPPPALSVPSLSSPSFFLPSIPFWCSPCHYFFYLLVIPITLIFSHSSPFFFLSLFSLTPSLSFNLLIYSSPSTRHALCLTTVLQSLSQFSFPFLILFLSLIFPSLLSSSPP